MRITVSKQFFADFELVASHFEWSPYEKTEIRNEIRQNFEKISPWISETAEILRFKDETFGTVLRLPTERHCQNYMLSRWGVWYDDDQIKRYGIMLLLKECARLAGRIK